MSLLNQYLNNKLAMQKAASAQEDVIPYLIKSSSAVGRVAAAIGKKLAQGAGKATKLYKNPAVQAGVVGTAVGGGIGAYAGYQGGYRRAENSINNEQVYLGPGRSVPVSEVREMTIDPAAIERKRQEIRKLGDEIQKQKANIFKDMDYIPSGQ